MSVTQLSPDSMDATAAIIKDTITPGPAISLATSPETTYIPVPTQLPTPSDTRSTVDKTRASLVPWELVPVTAESNIDSTGLVLRTRDVKVFHVEPSCILRGSSLPSRPLMLGVCGWDGKIHKEDCKIYVLESFCCSDHSSVFPNTGNRIIPYPEVDFVCDFL